MSEGFGLAAVKIAGKSSSFENPGVPPWNALDSHMREYCEFSYRAWYWKPFRKFLRKQQSLAWSAALYNNATRNHMIDLGIVKGDKNE